MRHGCGEGVHVFFRNLRGQSFFHRRGASNRSEAEKGWRQSEELRTGSPDGFLAARALR